MDKSSLKDHKQIGQELELFFTDDIAPGAPFWLPKGMVIFKELEKYIRSLTENAGYVETSTPIMVRSQLFVQSGHFTKFGHHNMYNFSAWENDEIKEIGEFLDKNEALSKHIGEDKPIFPFIWSTIFNQQNITMMIHGKNESGVRFDLPANYTLKPMNCPESTIIYRFKQRSYRELPLRLAEIGRLHRREKSGEVNGLLRVRQLTMDDAHIYVRESQILDEVSKILDMMTAFYKSFGFEYEFRFATRPEQRAGTDEIWNKAEKDLEKVLRKKNIKAGDKKGDGAFYGPKIDVHIKDALGREWQLATVQLDFHMPQAFDLKYINERGEIEKPVMIHRAIFGSFERFIAILTEHYQGAFPLWLSPVQVALLPITDRQLGDALKIAEKFKKEDIRVELDSKQESLEKKIRNATLQKVPYLGIIGDRELTSQTISVRTREGKDLGNIEIAKFLQKVKQEIDKKI